MHKRQPRPISPAPLLGITGLGLIAALGLGLGALMHRDPTPTGSVNALDGDPAIYIPAPTAVPKPLSLSLDLPELDQDQAYWYHQAQIVAYTTLTPTTIPVWLALIYTESRYQPWATSEIGCTGLGQLCGSLLTPETASDPIANLRASSAEFQRLLDQNDGELQETVRNYKGVTTWDTQDQANSVWGYLRVSP